MGGYGLCKEGIGEVESGRVWASHLLGLFLYVRLYPT